MDGQDYVGDSPDLVDDELDENGSVRRKKSKTVNFDDTE